ncbi:MAG: AAA family ATPase, partial [Burkholderiaceae bacterium]|nr:AAA family ATPase [Burkholderiaceae bacterium]
MPSIALALAPHQLRLSIDPASLGFTSTAGLINEPLPWIGQERAHAAAQFGLTLQQPDYHLFVLGEVGCGRSSLMRQAMYAVASTRPVPPDLCYLHNFEAPDRPIALRLPAGQGRTLQSAMASWVKNLQTDIPQRLASTDTKAEAAAIEKTWQIQEDEHFAALEALAQTHQFRIAREGGQMMFTLTGPKGQPLTESEARALPPARRADIDAAERTLRTELARFLEA